MSRSRRIIDKDEQKEKNSTNTTEVVEECIVCLEECKDKLECNHYIHKMCIAKAAQNVCSLCKKEVTFNKQEEQVYLQKKSENEEEKKETELRESEIAARNLNRQLNINNSTQVTISTHNRNFSVNLVGYNSSIESGDLMLELNKILLEINKNERNFNDSINIEPFELDYRALDLFKVMNQLNNISANSGIQVRELMGIIDNLTN